MIGRGLRFGSRPAAGAISGRRGGLVSVARRGYEKMTTEQYLLNTRQSFMNTQMQRAKLRPLLEASKYAHVT